MTGVRNRLCRTRLRGRRAVSHAGKREARGGAARSFAAWAGGVTTRVAGRAGRPDSAGHARDPIFPSMSAAIRTARSTMPFETCMGWSGSIGREFVDALSESARAGVRVPAGTTGGVGITGQWRGRVRSPEPAHCRPLPPPQRWLPLRLHAARRRRCGAAGASHRHQATLDSPSSSASESGCLTGTKSSTRPLRLTASRPWPPLRRPPVWSTGSRAPDRTRCPHPPATPSPSCRTAPWPRSSETLPGSRPSSPTTSPAARCARHRDRHRLQQWRGPCGRCGRCGADAARLMPPS